MNTTLKIILFLLILLLGISGLAFYWTFYRPLPDYRATYEFEALHEEVQIHWDAFGVPHIYAGNSHDLYFALGYVHAQDRLWQMTLTQLAAEGRLAEFLGEGLLSIDIYQRTIGFRRIAERLERELADSSRAVLQAYADGINSYVRNHRKELPIEFALTDIQPIEWTVTHSLALSRLMAWELNMAWKSELVLAMLQQKLPPGKMQDLISEREFYSSAPHRVGSDEALFGSLEQFMIRDEKLRTLLGSTGLRAGSNAWAVDRSKTDTGYPLLAGDPHLSLDMPGKWYEAHLNLDGRNASGATLAGAPVFILGQNDFLAWSLTNIMLDDTDFFVEAVNPTDSGQYVLDTLAGNPVYENFVLQRELVRIKGKKDTVITRRLTNHGPVISDIHPDKKMLGDRLITMKWTGFESSNELDALMGINWAGSFEEFQRYLPSFKVPGQNIIYADTSGNIARFSLASVPVRANKGSFFRRGWDSQDDWQGFVSFNDLPREVNPQRGWVANANNPIQPERYPYYLTIYWEPESRYNRIRQYLIQNQVFTPEAFQFMQNDTYSDYSREMTGIILPVLRASGDDRLGTVMSYLENWDFRYQANETAATIMDTFILKLSRNTFEDEMGEDLYQSFIRFSGLPSRILLRMLRDGSSFFDDPGSDDMETRDRLIVASMHDALDYLENEAGPEPFEWRWENMHTITFRPPLFAEAASDSNAPGALKLIVNNLMSKGPYPVVGHDMSINNGNYSWTDPFRMTLGPSIRRVVDFSDMRRIRSVLPTGQSGNPLSAHYGDQTDRWLNGQYKFLYQDNTLFQEGVYQTMKLVPAR